VQTGSKNVRIFIVVFLHCASLLDIQHYNRNWVLLQRSKGIPLVPYRQLTWTRCKL